MSIYGSKVQVIHVWSQRGDTGRVEGSLSSIRLHLVKSLDVEQLRRCQLINALVEA